MPIYEYECKQCRKPFEKLVRTMDSKEPIVCPDCGSKQTERKPSAFAAVSGSGKQQSMPVGCGRCGSPNPCPNG